MSPVRSLRSSEPLCTSGALSALGTGHALCPDLALGPGGALGALSPVRSLRSDWSLRSSRSLSALSATGSRRPGGALGAHSCQVAP